MWLFLACCLAVVGMYGWLSIVSNPHPSPQFSWYLDLVYGIFLPVLSSVGENYTPDNEIAHLFSKRHKKFKYHLCLRQKNIILSMNTCKTSNQLKIQNPLYLNMVPYFGDR